MGVFQWAVPAWLQSDYSLIAFGYLVASITQSSLPSWPGLQNECGIDLFLLSDLRWSLAGIPGDGRDAPGSYDRRTHYGPAKDAQSTFEMSR